MCVYICRNSDTNKNEQKLACNEFWFIRWIHLSLYAYFIYFMIAENTIETISISCWVSIHNMQTYSRQLQEHQFRAILQFLEIRKMLLFVAKKRATKCSASIDYERA